MGDRPLRIFLIGLAVSLLLAMVSGVRLWSAASEAGNAQDDLTDARELAGRLQQLRDRPQTARAGLAPAGALNDLVRDAARQAGIESKLRAVEPGRPVPVRGSSDTGLTETSVALRFDPLTLREATTMLAAVSAGRPWVKPSLILMETPAARPHGEFWDVDLTLVLLQSDDPSR
ncbi:MAG: hypothetical protein AAGK78_01430 [Planctomycetota bacterium]